MENAMINQMLNQKKASSSKTEISPDETLEIYSEFLEILMSHNVSFEVATKLAISFSYAFQMGEMELRKGF